MEKSSQLCKNCKGENFTDYSVGIERSESMEIYIS